MSGRRPPAPVPPRLIVEELYAITGQIAEHVAALGNLVAALDDNVLSPDVWSLEQAVLRLDRDLRARR